MAVLFASSQLGQKLCIHDCADSSASWCCINQFVPCNAVCIQAAQAFSCALISLCVLDLRSFSFWYLLLVVPPLLSASCGYPLVVQCQTAPGAVMLCFLCNQDAMWCWQGTPTALLARNSAVQLSRLVGGSFGN
jgi:hypothetical protein